MVNVCILYIFGIAACSQPKSSLKHELESNRNKWGNLITKDQTTTAWIVFGNQRLRALGWHEKTCFLAFVKMFFTQHQTTPYWISYEDQRHRALGYRFFVWRITEWLRFRRIPMCCRRYQCAPEDTNVFLFFIASQLTFPRPHRQIACFPGAIPLSYMNHYQTERNWRIELMFFHLCHDVYFIHQTTTDGISVRNQRLRALCWHKKARFVSFVTIFITQHQSTTVSISYGDQRHRALG